MHNMDRFGLLASVTSADGTEIIPVSKAGIGAVGGGPNAVVSVAQIQTFIASGALTPTSVASSGAVTSSSPSAGIGYVAGAGGAITQITSRTTGVQLDKLCGAITLFSAAGSATFASFTVSNAQVGLNDEVVVWQKSGTDLYHLNVTNVQAGSFKLSFATTGGTTTEQPVFGFAVRKGAIS